MQQSAVYKGNNQKTSLRFRYAKFNFLNGLTALFSKPTLAV